jgi:hypothetical protein
MPRLDNAVSSLRKISPVAMASPKAVCRPTIVIPSRSAIVSISGHRLHAQQRVGLSDHDEGRPRIRLPAAQLVRDFIERVRNVFLFLSLGGGYLDAFLHRALLVFKPVGRLVDGRNQAHDLCTGKELFLISLGIPATL